MSQPSHSGHSPSGHSPSGHGHGHGSHSPASGNKVLAWLESRTGYTGLIKLMIDEPVPGGARWWYVFGSVVSFILTLQLLTGISAGVVLLAVVDDGVGIGRVHSGPDDHGLVRPRPAQHGRVGDGRHDLHPPCRR